MSTYEWGYAFSHMSTRTRHKYSVEAVTAPLCEPSNGLYPQREVHSEAFRRCLHLERGGGENSTFVQRG